MEKRSNMHAYKLYMFLKVQSVQHTMSISIIRSMAGVHLCLFAKVKTIKLNRKFLIFSSLISKYKQKKVCL